MPRTCTFPGCDRLYCSRGVCDAHYQQLLRGIELKPLAYKALSLEQRFWQKVRKGDGCWEWTANRDEKGYGRFRYPGARAGRAHRFSYIHHFGPIAGGLQVCHRCDNPPCVRPDHLFLGTNSDNQKDSVQKGRNRGPRGTGHPLSVLSPDDIKRIRSEVILRKGVYQRPSVAKRFAAEFGVSLTLIYAIANRKTWKHVA